MKKGFFSVIVLLSCCFFISGCIKNTPYVTTLNPYLTASIGTYNFTANTVVPALLDSQLYDTSYTLIITGNSAEYVNPYDKIVLTISKYRLITGINSIVQGQATANYIHDGISYPASGGIVAVTKITDNSIIGYFSFTTASGLNVTNGAYCVGKPWRY